MNSEVSKARKKLENCILKFFMSDPMILSALCMVDKHPDTRHKTLGLDLRTNKPCIRYNPKFINMVSNEQLESCLVQEGLKILLRHPTTRLNVPKMVSSLASTITVVPMSLSTDLAKSLGIYDFLPTPKKFGLEDNKFYEFYFRKLNEQFDDLKKQIKELLSKEKESKNDNSEEKDYASCTFEEFKDDKEAMKEYYDPNSTNLLDWYSNELFDADIQNMIKEKKGSGKNWGKYTKDHIEEIIAANTSKISWKEIIKRFSCSITSRKTCSSRMKYNRRYGNIFPGFRREYDTKILFAVDVSGSMSIDDLEEMFSIINSTCDHAEISYLMFDTEIKIIETKLLKAKKKFKVHGRGGTDFQPVVEYAEKNVFDGVIIATDGMALVPTRSSRKPKFLWLMSNKSLNPPVDWDFVTHLDKD